MDKDGYALLDKIIKEVKENCVSVAWNNGFDTVLFIDRSIDGKKSLQQILKENIYNDKD
jgi:hypothetical protein